MRSRLMRIGALLLASACSGGPSADSDAGSDADVAPDVVEASPPPACNETDPRTPPLGLIVMPDDGQTPFTNVLEKATVSIDMLDYDLGSGGILTTLLAKAKAGVAVRVILDTTQQPYDQAAFDSLSAAGAQVEWSDPQFTYMHAKTFVVDGIEAVISSGNFVASQMAAERNYAVVDDDPQDVAVLSALISADWARQAPDLSCTRLLVSPVNAKSRILSLIGAAQTTLDVESMELSDTDVQAALVAAQKRWRTPICPEGMRRWRGGLLQGARGPVRRRRRSAQRSKACCRALRQGVWVGQRSRVQSNEIGVRFGRRVA